MLALSPAIINGLQAGVKEQYERIINLIQERDDYYSIKIRSISGFIVSDKSIMEKLKDLIENGSLQSIHFINQTRPRFFENNLSSIINDACQNGREDILNYLNYTRYNLDNLEPCLK